MFLRNVTRREWRRKGSLRDSNKRQAARAVTVQHIFITASEARPVSVSVDHVFPDDTFLA